MRAPNNLNALRAFEASARHQSYVLAADELNVTPAAVGQLVRGLEETLGVTLFHRAASGPARLLMTEEARAVIPDLQNGFDLLAQAVARLKASVARASITVTVPPAFADKWLLGRVERFQTRHPQYDLVLDTNGRIVDFNTDRVDVGIRYGGGRWPGLTAVRLLSDDFFPVCSPALLAGAHPLTSAAALKHHALIHDASMRFEKSFPTWRSWLARAGVKGVNTEKGLQINDSAAVMQAAIAGGGVALGRTSLVRDDLAAGRLVRPFGESQPFEFAYYVVSRAGVAQSPAVAAFQHWLLDEAARDEAG
jgi:LysR family glycine cleavage system transcriptional activator